MVICGCPKVGLGHNHIPTAPTAPYVTFNVLIFPVPPPPQSTKYAYGSRFLFMWYQQSNLSGKGLYDLLTSKLIKVIYSVGDTSLQRLM